MGIDRGMAALLATIAVVVAAPSLSSAVAVDEGGPPCFHACFDQCVPRDDFWFCQFSCYTRCAAGSGGTGAHALRARGLGCEQSCALSMCAQLRPGSKMMAACRDTCRKSYALAPCGQ